MLVKGDPGRCPRSGRSKQTTSIKATNNVYISCDLPSSICDKLPGKRVMMLSETSEKHISLTPGGFDNRLRLVNFKLVSMIISLSVFCEIIIRWMPLHLTDHKATLVQVMAWCRQATNPYLRSLSPYDVTRPQWVNGLHIVATKATDHALKIFVIQM